MDHLFREYRKSVQDRSSSYNFRCGLCRMGTFLCTDETTLTQLQAHPIILPPSICRLINVKSNLMEIRAPRMASLRPCYCTVPSSSKEVTLQRKSHLCILFLGIARPQSQFPHTVHVSVSDLYIPRMGPHISCSRIGRSIVGIQYIKSSVDAQFLFWEYLLQLFGIGSLQCILF